MSSIKPTKQRKAVTRASLHEKRKFFSAHLSKELKKQFKRRSLMIRKGDEVKVMRGKSSGKTGKVSKVDLVNIIIFIEGVTKKKGSGEEIPVPIHPSNVLITNAVMEDKERKNIIDRKKV